jgi:tetratricopeptide (TPR) repeat protein
MLSLRHVMWVVALTAALGLRGTVAGGSLTAEPGPAERAPHSTATVHDRDIEFYEARVLQDPAGAMDRMRLADLYLQRGQVNADERDLARAEAMARASLQRRRAHNVRAFAVLAAALLAQHQFQDALVAARALVAEAPESPPARALLGEVLLELGAYAETRALFQQLSGAAAHPEVATRLARWHELEGRLEESERLLRDARARALALHELPAAQRAWFHLRAGDFALRYHRWHQAEEALAAGLAGSPDDPRLLAAHARLAAARGDWPRVISDGERALAIAFDPATLALLAEARTALGDTAGSRRLEQAIDVALLHPRGAFHRAWSLYLLDRGTRVQEVLRRAEAELTTRRDVYGWDVYAWALHRSGRHAEAAAAMDSALAQGTRDPLLLRHARIIREAAR